MNRESLKIFQPITIGSMTMINRIANAPFGSVPMGDGAGYISDLSISNVTSLLNSDIGMLMCGIVNCMPTPMENREERRASGMGSASLEDDTYIEGWKRLADYAHSFGVCLGVQVGEFSYQGHNRLSELPKDNQKYRFFTFENKYELPEMHTWTKEELDKLAENVAQAGRRAKEAGLDCVEIHAAHGTGLLYAIATEPFLTERDDEYGGPIENRYHLLDKTVTRMRELVGSDFPIFVRINGDDLKGTLGMTIEDVCKYVVPILENMGISGIDVSQGGPMFTTEGPLPPMYYPRGCWSHLWSEIKKNTKLPVIGAGRVTTVEMAAKYIEDGSADVIYFGRELFADGSVVKNYLRDGNDKATRQCIACLKLGCMSCTVNYEERHGVFPWYDSGNLNQVEHPKKILVIGGGVAGMEAARTAAQKGHTVALWERDIKLGGTVGRLASMPLTSEFQNLIEYQSRALGTAGVEVRLCYAATPERVRAYAPDVVLLAAGHSMPLPESCEGALMAMDHLDAFDRKREFRSVDQWHKKVVIYGFTAAEFALDLAAAGCDVTLIGAGGDDAIAGEGYITRERKVYLRRKLTDVNFVRGTEASKRVTNPVVYKHSKLEGADQEGFHFYHNGIHKTVKYDAFIFSGPRKKNDGLYESLSGIVPRVIKIGDCKRIGNIGDAIISANEAVRRLPDE